MVEVVQRIIQDKRSSGMPEFPKDVAEVLLNDESEKLTDDLISDNLIDLMIPGEDSVPVLITLAVKFLSDCPAALLQLTEENMKLKRLKDQVGEPLSWSDYLSLPFTQTVITETLRMGNVIVGVMRKAMEDVEIKGYLIPKGWCVFTYFRSVHLDENLYDWPYQFNPWRWQSHVFVACKISSRAAPARRVSTLVVACATAGPLGRLPLFASSSHLRRPAPLRESSVAGGRSHLPPDQLLPLRRFRCRLRSAASRRRGSAAFVYAITRTASSLQLAPERATEPASPLVRQISPLASRTAPPPALAAPAVAPPQSRTSIAASLQRCSASTRTASLRRSIHRTASLQPRFTPLHRTAPPARRRSAARRRRQRRFAYPRSSAARLLLRATQLLLSSRLPH
ncbi:hypothetical protein U1Q18_006475 [Sarracenia purpurea var. burkii]